MSSHYPHDQLAKIALDTAPFSPTPKQKEKIQLGEGTYSTVVSANGVAIKIFKEARDPAAIQEISILRYLSHPNIIRINGIIIDNEDGVQMFMNLYATDISHSKWRYYVAGNQIIHTIVTIASNIASALSYMHSHKVMHCDIKPQNILYDIQTKSAILCDFNSAIYNPPKFISTKVQTFNYRAPEVDFSKRLGQFSYKIDVYSFGCILFELFTDTCFIYPDNIKIDNTTINDSTYHACNAFKFPQFCENSSRTERYDFLKTMTFKIARSKIIQRIESTKWNDINFNSVDVQPPACFPQFLNDYIDLITNCLMPYYRYRYDSSTANMSILSLFKHFGDLRPVEEPQLNLPLSLMPHADNIIKTSLKEHITPLSSITTDIHQLELGKNRVICKNAIFNLIPDNIVAWIRMLELNFYTELKRSKIVGSIEELITIGGAIYLIYCITDNLHTVLDIYENQCELHNIEILNEDLKKTGIRNDAHVRL